MKKNVFPLAISLVITATISLPTQSNEYTGKAICQNSIKKASVGEPGSAAGRNDGFYKASPILLLLNL